MRDVAHLAELHAEEQAAGVACCHKTRNRPRRDAEILAGGSLYWVIGGVILVRQRILDIRADSFADSSACTALMLDPALVRVAARPMRAFQGWRYLEPAAAPQDLTEGAAGTDQTMPEGMRRALAALALL